MEARAIARGIGMSPRKMRMVVDLIRGRGVNEAYSILKFSKKAATRPIEKTLRSAVANATQKAEGAGSFVDVDDPSSTRSSSPSSSRPEQLERSASRSAAP
jgi:large subunit ribosomal protein L22